MICQKCNNSIPETVKFCPKCGNKVEAQKQMVSHTKKCPSCGAENPVSDKFCKVDGYDFMKSGVKPAVPDTPKDEIICQKCGESYPPATKFCKKDGTPLKSGRSASDKPIQPETQKEITPFEVKKEPTALPEKTVMAAKETVKPDADRVAITPPLAETEMKEAPKGAPQPMPEAGPLSDAAREKPKSGSKVIVFALAAIVLIAAGAGSYFYFSGKKADKAVVQEAKNEPKQEPVSAPKQEPAREAPQPAAPPQEAKPDVKQNAINKKPEKIIAKPSNTEPKNTPVAKAPKPAVQKPEIKETLAPAPIQKPKIDPVQLEVEINRAMKNAGLRGVTAEVNDNLEVALNGTVNSRSDKDEAFEIAKSFKDARRIKDRLFVVGE